MVSGPHDLLEQLRDLHLPPEPSWWPPAAGWWVLIGLLFGIVVLWQYVRRRKRRRPAIAPYQQVRIQLDHLRSNYADNADTIRLLAGLSALIRQAAMTLSTREEVAKLTGDVWLNWLDQHAGKVLFMSDKGRVFASAHYQVNAAFEADAVLQICEEWLKIVFEKDKR